MNKKNSFVGKFMVGLTGTAALGLVAISVPFVLPAIRKVCIPYVPATDKQIKNVMKMLQNRNGNVIDLGSGDGRIVLEAAKAGYEAHGVELNPWLVLFSRLKASSLGLSKRAQFSKRDIWKTPLNNYDTIIIFGVEEMMQQLERKLCEELSSESCVVACRFPLPNWTPISTISAGIDTVWLYKKNQHIKK